MIRSGDLDGSTIDLICIPTQDFLVTDLNKNGNPSNLEHFVDCINRHILWPWKVSQLFVSAQFLDRSCSLTAWYLVNENCIKPERWFEP